MKKIQREIKPKKKMPRAKSAGTTEKKKTSSTTTTTKSYAERRMCKKHASSAARDMRSGDKEAAKYMSSYRKHVQTRRMTEAAAATPQPQSTYQPSPAYSHPLQQAG